MKMPVGLALIGTAFLLFPSVLFAEIPDTARVVREEALRSQQDPSGRPLPLVAHWHRASLPLSFQLQLIRDGVPLLPWIDYHRSWSAEQIRRSYGSDLPTVRSWNLPLTLVTGGQWEADFYSPEYIALPVAQTGVALNLDGTRMSKVDPMSPIQPWEDLGKKWTNNAAALQLQSLYPDPPRVFFISNNEAMELRWTEAESSKRFVDAYGTGWDLNVNFGIGHKPDRVRTIFQDGWIERYSALISGMRSGLSQKAWQENAKFMAYNATYKSFGPSFIGRSTEWNTWALTTDERVSHSWYAWEGTTTEAYDNHWQPDKRAFTYWSVQSEMMNHVFMKEEAFAVNPEFWFELIFWDGDWLTDSKYQQYASQGVGYTPGLYSGWVQYSMWLLVPRVAREWRKSDDDYSRWWNYFQQIINAVVRVHKDSVLTKFWRQGELVPNLSRGTSFNRSIPEKWAEVPRWYHLNTSVDPELFQYPHSAMDFPKLFPVWTLARVIGSAPNREWLVYAHAPLGEKTGVEVTIPGYADVTLPKITIHGSFYHVVEATGEVTEVGLTDSTNHKPMPPMDLRVDGR